MAKDFKDYHYFYYIGNNKSHAFRTYNDRMGKECGYATGYDPKYNQPIYKAWIMDNGPHRQIRVHKDQVDVTGKSALEFLRNSPECAGSANGHYDDSGKVQYGVFFKEVDTEKDARNALDTRKRVFDAQNAAYGLKGQDLVDVASIIGIFDTGEEVMLFKVLDYASNFPDKFLGIVEDPSRKILSLIRRAVNMGALKIEGRIVRWENEVLGADESEAVTRLLKDEKIKKALEVHLEKLRDTPKTK